jgi:Mce-associated membrane protein
MAADADAAEGEMSDPETTKQASTESETPSESSSTEDEATAAGDVEAGETSDAESESDEPDAAAHDDDAESSKRRISISPVRLAVVVGVVAIFALGGVVGWLGHRTYQLREDQQQRELFLRVGRQGAVNLTTIDCQNVNSDIQRILDSATGAFYDDFLKRSQPFIDVVKKVQSKSVGTVIEAGLESVSGNEARVLVAISVKTSNLGAEDQPPRSWRMRIDVTKVDGGAKISNVLFVPA